MPSRAAARRYAQAAFQIASEQGKLDAWREDLRLAAQVLGEPQLKALLEAPQVPRAAKHTAVRQAIASLAPLVINLVLLLVDHGRVGLIGGIAEEFQALVQRARGVVTAEVVTAIPLAAKEEESVAARLAELTGKRVQLRTAVNPAILGGLVVRIGDKLIDGSLASRLTVLRQHLAQGA